MNWQHSICPLYWPHYHPQKLTSGGNPIIHTWTVFHSGVYVILHVIICPLEGSDAKAGITKCTAFAMVISTIQKGRKSKIQT